MQNNFICASHCIKRKIGWLCTPHHLHNYFLLRDLPIAIFTVTSDNGSQKRFEAYNRSSINKLKWFSERIEAQIHKTFSWRSFFKTKRTTNNNTPVHRTTMNKVIIFVLISARTSNFKVYFPSFLFSHKYFSGC